MNRAAFIVVLVALGMAPGWGRAQDAAEQKAIAAIEKLGGKTVRGGDGPGSIVELDLSFTRTTNADLAHVAALRGLRRLDIAYTPVTDAGLAHLSGLTRLRSLQVGYPQMQGVGRSLVSNAGLA